MELEDEGLRFVPTRAENSASRVLSLVEIFRDLKSGIQDSFIKSGPGRIEDVAANFFPVYPKFVIAQAADKGSSPDR